MASQLQSRFACILLAAGFSSRMQKNKLLLPFGPQTILDTCLDALGAVPLHEKILVHAENLGAISTCAVKNGFAQIINPHPHAGIHSSIRIGLQHLSSNVDTVLIALADQPLLRTDHYLKLMKEFDRVRGIGKDLLRPMVNGIPGNPCLISLKYRNDILIQPDQDRGCFYLFKRFPQQTHLHKSNDFSFITDIDTPEDYQKCVT